MKARPPSLSFQALRSAAHGVPPAGWLASILFLAIVLRALFFVGLASGDPQDDGVYYGNAFALYDVGPRYLQQYRDLPADFLANPIDQFNVRPMVTYPVAASFVLFGPGELPATLWSLICSLVSVFVAYRLGLALHGRTVGYIAALLCAIYPLEVINGTRILSDAPVGMFCSLSLWLFVDAIRKRSGVLSALAGTAAAGAYLANGRGLIFFLAISGCAFLLSAFRKTSWWTPVTFVLGFLAIFSIEALVYLQTTGDPFLSYHIQAGASRFKYLHESVSSTRWGWLNIEYTNGRPFELTRTVLGLDPRPTNQFGLFFYLFSAAALFSLVRRVNLLLVALALSLFMYLEFGPVGLSIDWAHRQLSYMMLFKQERFLLMLTAPIVVVTAQFLHTINRRSQLTATALILVIFATSLFAIVRTRDYYRDGLRELRTVADYVRAHPDRLFVGDFWAILHLKIFTRYLPLNLAVLDTHSTLDSVDHACLILGGSRGVELNADYVESTLPVFAREALDTGVAPPHWTLVAEIGGERNAQRLHDLRLYCLP